MKTSNSSDFSMVRSINVLSSIGRVELSARLRLKRIAGVILCLGFLLVWCASSLPGQTADQVDGVTVKGEKAFTMRGDRLEVLKVAIKLPYEVEINTNGVFKVANGKARKLAEGQVIRRDGWLVNPDGSAQPVFDHVAMKAGKVVVVRGDRIETVTEPMTFTNNLAIAPDGACVYPDGNRSRLADGQLFRLDGSSIPAQDTASLKNGQVVVQKDGTLIPLLPLQIMGMSDGTRVQGDGTIQHRDGTTTQLREGQTVLIEGAAARH